MFSIPEDAGRRVALAKSLISLLDDSEELLVQIGDWAVWPSGQHMPLFDRFREHWRGRPLIEAPGHVIPAANGTTPFDSVLSVLYLWNCHVLRPTAIRHCSCHMTSTDGLLCAGTIAGTRESVA